MFNINEFDAFVNLGGPISYAKFSFPLESSLVNQNSPSCQATLDFLFQPVD
jgi:hypothetical protein